MKILIIGMNRVRNQRDSLVRPGKTRQTGKEIVGVSNLRHRLTPKLQREGGNIGYGVRPSARRNGFGTVLLTETLKMAKAKGLNRVLITYGKTNLGSVQVILRNGGVLKSEEFIPERGEVMQRFWIELS